MIEFFIPLKDIPTHTAQQRRLGVTKDGKPFTYKDEELKDIENMFLGELYKHAPEVPIKPPVRLITRWLFRNNGSQKDGEYKITKPDTDNLLKLFKDCMAKLGYFKDDSHVASELTEKFWANTPGIYVKAERITDEH